MLASPKPKRAKTRAVFTIYSEIYQGANNKYKVIPKARIEKMN